MPATKSPGEWLHEIRAAMARGELIEAYDLAQKALDSSPDDLALQHLTVLVLARSGATRHARSRYEALRLGVAIRGGLDSPLKLDIAALDARIAKDEALGAPASARQALLKDAAARYERIFRRVKAPYPGISAATLWLLCGRPRKSESLAREVIEICRREDRGTELDAYFSFATEAEAALILGDLETARTALGHAGAHHGGDLSALATTRRELKMVCGARGIDAAILAPLSAPSVIHYSGHMIGPRFPLHEEARVRGLIAASMERLKVGFGYGSLAAGGDTLFAEALLERGADLHVTIPFAVDEFKRVSVAPSGDEWINRFDRCLDAAKTVTMATSGEYLGDDVLFGHADRIAMGLALLRARFLDTEVHQIAVWDHYRGGKSGSVAGTAASVAFWHRRRLPQLIIDSHSKSPASIEEKPERTATPRRAIPAGRTIRAFLFCDVKGFSQLREPQLPIFEREVLGRFARVLARYRRQILFRNTWGDGLYVVTSQVESAAGCAIDLLDEMAAFNPIEHGLPEYLGIRLGGHLGPVYRLRDPVLRRWNFVGSHVSLAARIEPVTPEGAAYVTEAFAAALAIEAGSAFDCEYAGQVPAAKQYGTMRMYVLRRKTAAEPLRKTAADASAAREPPGHRAKSSRPQISVSAQLDQRGGILAQ